MGPQLANDEDREREVRVSISALVRDHPTASPDRIEQLLRSHLARTAGASVQLYRVLLAERATRVQLRLDEHAEAEDDRVLTKA